jgi:putative membrane protein
MTSKVLGIITNINPCPLNKVKIFMVDADDFEEKDPRLFLARERTLLANERNRLANERTFLAWVRTGLATVGVGFALEKFFVFYQESHRILAKLGGEALVILGICIFLISCFDYYQSYQILKPFKKNIGFWAVILITTILVIVSILLLLITFHNF